MSSSKILFLFCIFFVLGIFSASFFRFPLVLIIEIFIFSLFLISVFLKNKQILILGFCFWFFIFGILRYQTVFFKIQNQEIVKAINTNEEIELEGFIIEEPKKGEKIVQLKFESEKGRVLINTNLYPEYQYGDKIRVLGKLEKPLSFGGFNYSDFLLKEKILTTMNFPKIEKIGQGFGNPLKKFLIYFKKRLEKSLNENFSFPFSGFLEALLFGEEKNISKEWKEKLNLTSMRHITAVSGMNITIISNLIFIFLLSAGLWRQHAFFLSVIFILLFVLMIGAPPSAVRAGIMGIVFLAAQHFGRLSSPQRIVFLTGSLMLFQNPLILRYDISFQLSFLATLGLIYLYPVFCEVFRKIPNFFQLRANLSATLSAQLFVLPILIYNFGQISLTSIFPNIFVLPVLPVLTILGFFSSFVGIFFHFLGYLFSFLSLPFLFYLLNVIEIFSKISLSFNFVKIHWIFLLLFYLLLGLMTYFLNKKFSQPFFLR